MYEFIAYLLSTDVKILVGIIILALITLAALAFVEADQEVHVYDWYYKDDRGNTYLVTSASIEDNWDLLIRDHGLSAKYILDHVFLADHKEVN